MNLSHNECRDVGRILEMIMDEDYEGWWVSHLLDAWKMKSTIKNNHNTKNAVDNLKTNEWFENIGELTE